MDANRRMKSLLPAALATLLLVLPAVAQDTSGPNLEANAGGTPAGAATYAMAHSLFAIGMANKDALAVLSAARLAASVELTEGPVIRKTTDGASPSDSPDTTHGPIDIAGMLAAAKSLAQADDTLLGLIERISSEALHGRFLMATRRPSVLLPGASDRWDLPLFGGSYAEIAVVGGDDGRLSFRVADDSGTIVCQDDSGFNQAICGLVPARNAYFFVTVGNTGPNPTRYYLLTN